MAKEANVKLTLNAGGFAQAIDNLKGKVRSFAAEGREQLSQAFGKGATESIKGMGGALKEVGSSLKSHLSMAASLGGAVGFGSMVKGAVEMRSQFERLEFDINKTGKATVAWADMMDRAREVAGLTGHSTSEIGDVMQKVFGDTGDLEFTSDAIEAIGTAATASHQPLDKLAGLAGMLKEKFGATAQTLPQMMAVFLEKTDAGAVSLDDLGMKFGLLAGEAADAGMGGSKGLSTLLGMLDQLDDRIGEKSVPAMKKLLQTLKGGGHDLKEIGVKAGIKFGAGEDAVSKLRKIIGSETGRNVMVGKLGGELRVVFDELAKPFNEAAAQAKAEGKSAKAQKEAGLLAFDEAMGKASKSTLKWSDVMKTSERRVENDPAVRLQAAIDKVQAAFTRPEMLDAIDQLADKLPALADALVKMVNFAVKHPMTTGAMMLGGKVGMAGVQGFATGALESVFKGAPDKLGKGIEEGMKKGGDTFLGSLGSAKQWAQAGAIIGAAMAAYQVGKEAIDSELDEHFGKMEKLSDVQSSAEAMMNHGVGSDAERKAAADALSKRIKSMEKEGGPGVTAKLFGNAANMIDSNIKMPETEWYEQLNKAKSVLAELEGQIKVKENADRVAASLDKMDRAATKVAGTLDKVEPPAGTPSGTSKGPPRPGNSGSGAGHAPVVG